MTKLLNKALLNTALLTIALLVQVGMITCQLIDTITQSLKQA